MQNFSKRTYWKTSNSKTRKEMDVNIAICLGDIFEDEKMSACLLADFSALLTDLLLASVCEGRAGCCTWQVSNRLHVQSISRRGSAWRRVTHRHAPSRHSSGLRETPIELVDTRSTESERDRQTDRIRNNGNCSCSLFVYSVIFDMFRPVISHHRGVSVTADCREVRQVVTVFGEVRNV